MNVIIEYNSKRINVKDSFFGILLLLLITYFIHALVLKFVFPGYYSPLYPHHEDFYIPVAFANAPDGHPGFIELLNWPRPVNMIYLKLSGYLGVKGSIAITVFIVFLNCALTALFIKRVLSIRYNRFFFFIYAIYCFFLFSSQFFYIFYTHDAGAHLSYLFLVLGLLFYYSNYKKPPFVSFLVLTILFTIAFLSKETYFPVAFLFSFIWVLYFRKNSFKAAIVPLSAVCFSFLLAILNSRRTNSAFVDINAAEGSPYKIDLSFTSLWHEWWRYANEALNLSNILLLLFLLFWLLKYYKQNLVSKKILILFVVGCIIAPCISWIPNAILPNHHFNGYSFSGLYLFYLPLFVFCFLQESSFKFSKLAYFLPIVCLISCLLNIKSYKASDNQWVLYQEKTQRNLYNSLSSFTRKLPRTDTIQRILIQGIRFPFHPFTYPQSIREFPDAANAFYDVVNYNPQKEVNVRRDLVMFINPSDTNLVNYGQVWRFNEDGSLLSVSYDKKAGPLPRKPGDSVSVLITADSLLQFETTGIYGQEGNYAWTNGNVEIRLNYDIKAKGQLHAKLITYLPPVSKNVVPEIFFIDINNKEYEAALLRRENDTFYYQYTFNGKIDVDKIRIKSQSIQHDAADKRVLSFPLIELSVTTK